MESSAKKKKIKDMSRSEFKEYKAEKERYIRMCLSEDQKLDSKKKDLEAKRLVRSTMTEKEKETSNRKKKTERDS